MAEQSPKNRPESGAGSTGAGASGIGATGGASSTTPGSTGATGSSSGASASGASSGGTNATGNNIRQAVTSKVASAADSQKNRAAESIDSIADVARQTGEDLRGQNEMLASWVNAASDQLRTMADRLRDKPASELADDLTRFARQRPAVFLGGAFLLGLGVARLLRSSPEHGWSSEGNGRHAHGSGEYGTGVYADTGTGSGLSEGRSGTWSPGSGGGAY